MTVDEAQRYIRDLARQWLGSLSTAMNVSECLLLAGLHSKRIARPVILAHWRSAVAPSELTLLPALRWHRSTAVQRVWTVTFRARGKRFGERSVKPCPYHQ